MSIVLVGVNHKTAPIEVRELLAFSDEACTDGLRRLVDGEVVREGLIVSTCNRVEILSTTKEEQFEQGTERITQFLDSNRLPPDFLDRLAAIAEISINPSRSMRSACVVARTGGFVANTSR